MGAICKWDTIMHYVIAPLRRFAKQVKATAGMRFERHRESAISRGQVLTLRNKTARHHVIIMYLVRGAATANANKEFMASIFTLDLQLGNKESPPDLRKTRMNISFVHEEQWCSTFRAYSGTLRMISVAFQAAVKIP